VTRVNRMKAMILEERGRSLRLAELPVPSPGPHQVLVRVDACAVCRTDLHVIDEELPPKKRPLVPGHEIVGTVHEVGSGVTGFAPGLRVGIPWLHRTCGVCADCRRGRENLCPNALFTGYDVDGGYAEYALADERFCFRVPETYSSREAAPLLCAGLIGYRSYRMAGPAERLGIYGFGAAAHLLAQVAKADGVEVFAFTRTGDRASQDFARSLGVAWAGDAEILPPTLLDAAILFAPVGSLVPQALRAVRPGGTVVCGGIHMSDIPSFPYALLWGERVVRSVANLTRQDGLDFLEVASRIRIQVTTQPFPLEEANAALTSLRAGTLKGAAVLLPHP